MSEKLEPSALGIHLAAGVAWLAGTTANEKFAPDRVDRIVLEDQRLGEARAIHEFEQSLEELLGRLAPDVVGLLDAGSSKRPPPPSASRKRGALEGAVMLAGHRTSIPVTRVSHDQVNKKFGARPTEAALRGVLEERVDEAVPTKWADRAPALATAIVVLAERLGAAR